jgi:hypothetical protein
MRCNLHRIVGLLGLGRKRLERVLTAEPSIQDLVVHGCIAASGARLELRSMNAVLGGDTHVACIEPAH